MVQSRPSVSEPRRGCLDGSAACPITVLRGEGPFGYSRSHPVSKARKIRTVNLAPQPRGDASAAGVCLLKTRVWGSAAETEGRIGGTAWISSTLRWGWTPVYDGTAVGLLDQRYYATGAGRFMTADPYKASAGVGEPGSWNRYAYVEGDPVNFADVAGLARGAVKADFETPYGPPHRATTSFQTYPAYLCPLFGARA